MPLFSSCSPFLVSFFFSPVVGGDPAPSPSPVIQSRGPPWSAVTAPSWLGVHGGSVTSARGAGGQVTPGNGPSVPDGGLAIMALDSLVALGKSFGFSISHSLFPGREEPHRCPFPPP